MPLWINPPRNRERDQYTDQEWAIVTNGQHKQNMAFAAMTTGIPRITVENHEEFFERYMAAWIASGREPQINPVTVEVVRAFIGHATNATKLTDRQFRLALAEGLMKSARYTYVRQSMDLPAVEVTGGTTSEAGA